MSYVRNVNAPRRSMIEWFASVLIYGLLVWSAMCLMGMLGHAAFADTLPASGTLPNPITDPGTALTDIELAYKTGWVLALFAGLTMLTKLLGYFAAHLAGIPVIGGAASWLAQARNASIVAGVGTVAGAVYDSLANGGAWTAALIAAGVAIAGILHPSAAPAPQVAK